MGRRRHYSMGEIALATGLSRQTLHTYALLGLIRPDATTPGGHRRFAGRVFRRLDLIRGLKADHTLVEIRALVAGTGGRSR